MREPIDRLKAALTDFNYDYSKLKFRYHSERVAYPGGSYLNNQIIVTDGTKTEQYSAELTEHNSLVAAGEIVRMF